MKTTHIRTKFIEWLSAEDMHSNSKEWLSELELRGTETTMNIQFIMQKHHCIVSVQQKIES